jgi:glutaredoxin
MKISRTALALLASIALAGSLSACTATVSLEAAADSNNPACAEVSVRLPDQAAELDKRVTDAQATGAWGNPTAIILRCGLPPVEVSTLPCVTANGIDWLVDDTEKPSYRFITFGRNPATEVIVDSNKVAGVSALSDLSGAIQSIESTKQCTEVSN